MADYTVNSKERGALAKQLVANTIDTVIFVYAVGKLEVYSTGEAPIYFTVDGSIPTVAGSNTYELPSSQSAREVSVPSASDVVKLISSGTPKYSVSRVD